MKILKLLVLAGLLVFTACSKKPVLYDNAKYQASPEKAKAAVSECMEKAEKVGAKGQGKIAKSAERATVGGAASAAAGGAAAAAGGGRYHVGRSAGMSAAGGAAGNFALGMMGRDVDPIFARYVENCLADRGYRTIGWR